MESPSISKKGVQVVNHPTDIPEGIVAKRRGELILLNLMGTGIARTECPNMEKDALTEEAPPKLNHPTKDRPQPPHRRLPSKAIFRANTSRTFYSSKSGVPDPTGLSFIHKEDLLKVLLHGIQSYLEQSKKGTTTSEEDGWFSMFRHGSHGKGMALTLKGKFEDAESLRALVNDLDEFFLDPDTRFNNHSLASYLLDAINAELINKSQLNFRLASGEHYTKCYWGVMEKQLEKNFIEDTIRCDQSKI